MRTVDVPVARSVIEWALERADLRAEDLKQPVAKWIAGESAPTWRQLQAFAAATRTPIGLLLLAEPPQLSMPVPDFRTFADGTVPAPSVDLLHTIHLMQRRQAWFRDYLVDNGHDELDFVGSLTTSDPHEQAASTIREALDFDVASRRSDGDWLATRRRLVSSIEELGALVSIAGYVGGNTKRVLSVDEFRGFFLADAIAPAIFVNGRDSVGGQLFTLVHECAHAFLGVGGVDRPSPVDRDAAGIERWCNRVAAEVLVPSFDLARQSLTGDMEADLGRLARRYRASGLVILGQLHDAGRLSWAAYVHERDAELARALAASKTSSDGGDYYVTARVMVGQRLLDALLPDVRRGRTSPSEAMDLLETRSEKTLKGLADRYIDN